MAANVCGNHLGEYLGSLAFIIRGLIDPSSLEVIACREALSLAEDLGLQKLHCVRLRHGGEAYQEGFGRELRWSNY